MWNRALLKQQAKARISFNYWRMVLAAFIVTICSGSTGFTGIPTLNFNYSSADIDTTGIESMVSDVVSDSESMRIATFILFIAILVIAISLVIGLVLSTFLLAPLSLGCSKFFYRNLYEKADLRLILAGFEHNYLNNVKILFLASIKIFLWSLLFIIPGIIKSYEYFMIPYILADNPNITAKEAFEKSRIMMTGNKWNTFVLDLSFIGWNILSVFTLGILSIFYVNPYISQTHAALYAALKLPEVNTSYSFDSFV